MPDIMSNDLTALPLILGIGSAAAVLLYVWTALALAALFRKIGQEPWKAWVPILNQITLLLVAGLSGWLFLLVLVPVLGGIAFYAVTILAAHRINRGLGFGAGMTVLAALLFPVWASIAGFGSSLWRGADAARMSAAYARVGPAAPRNESDPLVPIVAPGPRRLGSYDGAELAPGMPVSTATPPDVASPATPLRPAFAPPRSFDPAVEPVADGAAGPMPPAPAGVGWAPPPPPPPAASTSAPVGASGARRISGDSVEPVPWIPVAPPAVTAAPPASVRFAAAPGAPVEPVPTAPLPVIERGGVAGPPRFDQGDQGFDQRWSSGFDEVSAIVQPPDGAPISARPVATGLPLIFDEEDGGPERSRAGDAPQSGGDAEATDAAFPAVTRAPAGPLRQTQTPAAPEFPFDTADEVSAVAGAPIAGAPRTAMSSIAFADAVATEGDGEDDFPDETVVARRRRVAWSLRPASGPAIDLISDVVIVGRQPAADRERPMAQLVAVPDETRTVSKTHARLELHGDRWTVTDLGSTNGVLLATLMGTEIEAEPGAELVAGERFLLGDAAFRLQRLDG